MNTRRVTDLSYETVAISSSTLVSMLPSLRLLKLRIIDWNPLWMSKCSMRAVRPDANFDEGERKREGETVRSDLPNKLS